MWKLQETFQKLVKTFAVMGEEILEEPGVAFQIGLEVLTRVEILAEGLAGEVVADLPDLHLLSISAPLVSA